jgi:4-diphosphocytidyl-2-C-methyl-D-erythritol kinase
MVSVKAKVYAKLNLSLDITGKRPDGYHTLCSVMQSVSLYDTVVISLKESTKAELKLTCSNGTICGEDNLAFVAAKRFFEAAGILPDADIYIEKRIPLAGGLGGGSADAAAVLAILNSVWDNPLSEQEIFNIALSLGADVPLCLYGGTKLAEGIGEELTPLKNMPSSPMLIAKKGVKSSTGAMYKALDSAEALKTSDLDIIKEGLQNESVEQLSKGLYNCFETVCGDDSLSVKAEMQKLGAVYAGLSGAGPSVFGIFKTVEDRDNAEKVLKTKGCEVFACTPTNKSFEII